jgi:hypothetical protein
VSRTGRTAETPISSSGRAPAFKSDQIPNPAPESSHWTIPELERTGERRSRHPPSAAGDRTRRDATLSHRPPRRRGLFRLSESHRVGSRVFALPAPARDFVSCDRDQSCRRGCSASDGWHASLRRTLRFHWDTLSAVRGWGSCAVGPLSRWRRCTGSFSMPAANSAATVSTAPMR